MDLEAFLSRLQGVRAAGKGRFKARCPAHPDKNPSLSVTSAPDGRILLHDFAGCDTGAILSALGLAMGDLFPDGPKEHAKGGRPQFTLKDAFHVLSFEGTVMCMIGAEFLETGKISNADLVRLAQAVRRITEALEFCHGHS